MRTNKTLIEKLLSGSVANEKAAVLQCVHYLVANNFFHTTVNTDTGANTSTDTNSDAKVATSTNSEIITEAKLP